MFSLSGAVETFRRYLLIQTDILQKTVDGCPCYLKFTAPRPRKISEALPVVHSPRKIPVPRREKVFEELKKMEKLGVIVRQEEPSLNKLSDFVDRKSGSIIRAECTVDRKRNGAFTYSWLQS